MTTARPGSWKYDAGDGYFGSPFKGLSEKIRHHAGEFRERALFVKAPKVSPLTTRRSLVGSTLQRA
jgi:hypothetical protein